MKQAFIEGAVYGLILVSTGYFTIIQLGFNSRSLSILFYIQLISAIIINVKAETEFASIPFLKNLVVVSEGEEIKFRRLLTGETYKVNGEVEKL